ncbi:MAG: MAPEG family protein [Myxococcales bacterium]|nr:MAPEG family protein [Myxococcales bacterium]HRC55905.1 MAPEG family protein [Kofleriaceae bacterium]
MTSIFHDPVFQAYTLAVAAVVVTLYALGFITALRRAKRKIVINAEDASINGGATVADVEHPDVARAKRAHQNLIEAALPFLTVGFLYTMTAPGLTMARVLFATFVVARALHAVTYLGAKQPLRTMSFGIGTVVNVIMLVQILRTVVPLL